MRGLIRQAFTLIELLIVIVVIGIAFGLAMPSIGDTRALKVQSAARMLAGDIELAANEAIAHGSDPRLIKVDVAKGEYWIAPVSTPDVPVIDPVGNQPMRVSFGAGRAAGAGGVSITNIALGGDNELRFDAYGCPDQDAEATITLEGGGATLTVCVAPGSGEVSVR